MSQLSEGGGAWFGRAVPQVRQRLASVALGLVLSSTAAFADPLRVVEFGGVHTGGDDTGFFLSGAGFEFGVDCAPCTPGTALDLSATLPVSGWPAGRATVDGRTYDSVFFSGSLVLNAGSVIVPDMPPGQSGPDGEGLTRLFSTYTFSGTLAGFADSGLTGTPLFSADLVGRGGPPLLVRAAFSNYPPESGIRVYQLDYVFDNAAPVPEPGSLLLFGSGAAWIAARWRRRRGLRVEQPAS
jgi:hypothetical protein